MRSAGIPSLSVAPVAARSARLSARPAATTAVAPRAATPGVAVAIPAADIPAVVATPLAAAVGTPPDHARCIRPCARPAARRRKSPSSRGTTSRSTAASASRRSARQHQATAAATRRFRFADHTARGVSEPDRPGFAPAGRRLSGPPLVDAGPSNLGDATRKRRLAVDGEPMRVGL